MPWLSKGIDALLKTVADDPQREVEVLVIGSGYGGAVAALRLAEAGYDVHVLERGNERVPGEFPNDLSNLARHVRVERVDAPDVTGPRDGLFDIRVHKEVMTLVGSALGGTSQINANVAIAPDPELFREKQWPKALRDDVDRLPEYFNTVRKTLGVTTYGGVPPPAKVQALQGLGGLLRKSLQNQAGASVVFRHADLAVNARGGINDAKVTQGACTGCGDCVTGCNEGAKNTLTMNYLPLAYQAGASFYTGATVLAVDPGDDQRATVYLAHTAFAHTELYKLDRDAFFKAVREKRVFAVRAKFAVLAAGALGSTEILLRSQELKFLEASKRLGESFSGNGDGLHFGYDQAEEVNAIGWGAHRGRYNGGSQAPPPGPAIVSMLDVRTGPRPLERRLIQDGILPGPLAHVTHEALTTLAALTQLESASLRSNGGDALALSDKALRHTQVYLAMGHDDAKGAVKLTKENGRAFVFWDKAADQDCLKWQEETLTRASELGALFLPNPVLYPLPKAIANTLSGPPIRGWMLIVHPLGGCAMGETFADGVVNDVGAVHRPNGKPYSTLYVWDGSIVPGSIGVNPFLTIAALAERAVERVIQSRPKKTREQKPRPLPKSDPRVPRPTDLPRGRQASLKYKETLRGKLQWGKEVIDAALRLEMKFDDVVGVMSRPSHCVDTVSGVLQLPRRELCIKSGSVKLLDPEQQSGRRIRETLATLAVWFYKRGLEDLLLALRNPKGLKAKAFSPRGLWRLAKHASEIRRMEYDLTLEDGEKQRYRLVGTKVMRFGRRSNLWNSLLDLGTEITTEATRERVAHGRLRLDLLAFSEDNTAQFTAATDLPNALGALASLPLFFLRVILKLHLWDFRLPEYPPKRWHERRAPRRGLPEARSRELLVPAGNVKGCESIPLKLTRFGSGDSSRTPILLLHGYAQSSYAYLAPQLRQDLVRHLSEKKFDVWVLDYRTSTDLLTNKQQCTLDDVGRYDLPHAVDRIRLETGREQVMAFGHCMGAATLAMSLLSGKLRGSDGRSKIAAAVFSQVPPFVVGGFYSQYRRQVAAFWRYVVRADGIDLAAKENPRNFEAVMDRLFATLPYAVEDTPYGDRFVEDCSHVRLGPWPRRDTATCRRVFGLIGPLYLHENMQRSHALLHRYFGYGSVSVLTQVAKFFEYERLVTAEGSNVYVTDDNIRNHLDMPIGLLHGKRNQVFDPESAERSELSIRNARGRDIPCERIDIPANYAHFDCLAGDRAYEEVFPKVSEFLGRFANG